MVVERSNWKQSSHCVYETYKTEFIDGKIVYILINNQLNSKN